MCHKTSSVSCPMVVCPCFAALGGSSKATLTPGSVAACGTTLTTHFATRVWPCAARDPFPTTYRRYANVQQEFNCPLTQGSVATCGRSSTTHCPKRVWQRAVGVTHPLTPRSVAFCCKSFTTHCP